MVVAASWCWHVSSSRNWETGQDRGNYKCSNVQKHPGGKPDPRLGRRFIFEQDNDPKHRVKSSMAQLLQNNSVNVIEWLSQSPDWNLIEHLWRDLKMRGAAKRNE